MKIITGVLVLFIAVLCMGCGEKLPEGLDKLYPVELTITQESKPFEGATVSLTCIDKTINFTTGGTTGPDGKVVLFTQGKYAGIPAGKYKVRVVKTEMEKRDPSPSNPNSPEFAAWKKKYGNKPPQSWSLVEKACTRIETTPLEIEIKGAFKETLDVGKAVRDNI